MTIKILCSARMSGDELAVLDNYAEQHNLTREQVLRLAVAKYSATCVPTHDRSSVKAS